MSEHEVAGTGPAGATIFDFVWSSDDPLSKHVAPLRYGSVDVDFGGDHYAEGVIVDVGDFHDAQTAKPIDGVWVLRISVGPPDAVAVARRLRKSVRGVAVRVHS